MHVTFVISAQRENVASFAWCGVAIENGVASLQRLASLSSYEGASAARHSIE